MTRENFKKKFIGTTDLAFSYSQDPYKTFIECNCAKVSMFLKTHKAGGVEYVDYGLCSYSVGRNDYEVKEPFDFRNYDSKVFAKRLLNIITSADRRHKLTENDSDKQDI